MNTLKKYDRMFPQKLFMIRENHRYRLNSEHDDRFHYICCASRSTGCLARINRISKDIRLIGKYSCGKPIAGTEQLSSTTTCTVNHILIQLMYLLVIPNDMYFNICKNAASWIHDSNNAASWWQGPSALTDNVLCLLRAKNLSLCNENYRIALNPLFQSLVIMIFDPVRRNGKRLNLRLFHEIIVMLD
ncbi:hypothetical protein MXB_764 [Myxobolus squamalis]|nr:hypothetical protein MXB_764 [Myxobolus squamalis]